MNVIAAFLSAFFYVVFTQNLVFTGGYGTSEVIRSAARPRQILVFSVMIVYFSTFTSLICRLLLLIPFLKTASTTLTLVVYTAVLTVLYLVTVSIFRALLANSSWKQAEKDKLVRQTESKPLITKCMGINNPTLKRSINWRAPNVYPLPIRPSMGNITNQKTCHASRRFLPLPGNS